MPREPMSQDEFNLAVKEIKMAVNNLHALLNEQFPDGFVFDPDSDPTMATGSHWLNPRVDLVGRGIRGVVEWFTYFQERLGLPDGHEPRFRQPSYIEESRRG